MGIRVLYGLNQGEQSQLWSLLSLSFLSHSTEVLPFQVWNSLRSQHTTQLQQKPVPSSHQDVL